MNKEFATNGYWWLSNSPNKKYYGILKYSHEKGLVLKITKLLDKTVEEKVQRFIKLLSGDYRLRMSSRIILGVNDEGQKVSLYNCRMEPISLSLNSEKLEFYPECMYIGTHFMNEDEIIFKDVSFQITNLTKWFNINSYNFFENGYDKSSVENFNQRNTYKATLNKEASVYLSPKIDASIDLKDQIKSNFTQYALVQIEFNVAKNLEEIKKYIYGIRDFITFCIDYPTIPFSIKAKTYSKNNNKNNIDINLFLNDLIGLGFRENINQRRMLLTFSNLKDRYEHFLTKWFDNAKKLDAVYDLFFGIMYNPYRNPINKFLNIVQPVEVFHQRINDNNKYLDDKEYEKLYKKITNHLCALNVKKELETRLKAYLKYGNEYSLRKRFKELFKKYKFEDVLSFEEFGKCNSFMDKVVNTRNYYTHYDNKLRSKIIKKEKLYHYTVQLKKCLQVCLLNEIGFKSEEIRNLFSPKSS